MQVNVPAARYEDLFTAGRRKSQSEKMKAIVSEAFEVQKSRYKGLGICFNSELSAAQIQEYCKMTDPAGRLLEQMFEKMNLSARGYHRILKLSRTIADIEGAQVIGEDHVSEALLYHRTGGDGA